MYQRIACARRCAQAPHGHVEEPAVARLHTENRTLLEHQGMLCEDAAEVVGIVASNMADQGIERRPPRGMQGNGKDDRCPIPGYAAELAECLPIVLNVLDDVERADQVEAAVAERQGGYLAERRETAAATSRETAGRLMSTKHVLAMGNRGRRPAPTSSRAGAEAASAESSGQVLKRCGRTTSLADQSAS